MPNDIVKGEDADARLAGLVPGEAVLIHTDFVRGCPDAGMVVVRMPGGTERCTTGTN